MRRPVTPRRTDSKRGRYTECWARQNGKWLAVSAHVARGRAAGIAGLGPASHGQPNALNDGKANFPEFHSVYIEPGSYEIYKRTGEFRVVAIVSARIQAEDSAMSLQLGPFI